MSGSPNGSSPREGRPDPILAALRQLAQGRALDPLSQELKRAEAASRPREPVRAGRQLLPESMFDVVPFGELLELYDLVAPRKGRVEAPGPDAPPFLFEYYVPREEEIRRWFDHLRQLPPIPVRSKHG